MTRFTALAFLAFAACASPPHKISFSDSSYLYLWTAGADSTQPDYLAVVDVAAHGDRYGRVLSSLPVPGRRNVPHHSEHELAADGLLLANGFATGQTFAFDVRNPTEPRIVAQFGGLAGYSHPHTFERLPNGNVLATFQMGHDSAGMTPGGLVEMTPRGGVLRSGSSFGKGVQRGLRPYSALPVPALDRVISTTTDMDETNPYKASEIQVWRLSDLKLLHTIKLPQGPLGDEADFTAEPRLLADGRTVLVSTFNCGLYLLEGLEGDAPSGRLVSTLPRGKDVYCAIPIVAGNHYLVTVPSIPAVVSLDISNPAQPREVGRATLTKGDVPHWISLEPNGSRVVVTGYGALEHRVVLLTFDAATGALAVDQRFREEGASEPGLRINGAPHGAVFSRTPRTDRK
ncbi:MAG: hypothetical protein ABIS03_04095 [Gemmatimonadaceae bacterium]